MTQNVKKMSAPKPQAPKPQAGKSAAQKTKIETKTETENDNSKTPKANTARAKTPLKKQNKTSAKNNIEPEAQNMPDTQTVQKTPETYGNQKAPETKALETMAAPNALTHETRSVRVADLVLSPLNPRQTVSEDEIIELASSIKTIGLLQNLAGLETGQGNDTRVEIVFGGRRMRALQLIVTETNNTDMTVNVIMAKNPLEAANWAGAENAARSQPHPADEIIAYKKSIDLGATEDHVAKAFGVTVRHVKGRLKLANIAPVILDALRAGTITLDVAAAYTLCSDQAKQAEQFEAWSDHWIGRDPREIKARLNEVAIDGATGLAKFVTREAYEEAGGKINEDLFGDDLFFLDTDLLYRLADEKRQTIKAEFEAQGWKWVEALQDSPSWEDMRSYRRTFPKVADINEEDEADYNELEALIESGHAQQADIDAFETLQIRLRKQVFSKTQKDHSGLIFWIDFHGGISTNEGYVHPDDMKEAIAAGVLERERSTASESTKKKGPYPEALQRDMATIRTTALQSALFRDPDFALDILIFSLATPIYSDQQPVGISTTNKKIHLDNDDGLVLPDVLDRADYSHAETAKSAAKGFEQFRSLSKELKTGMMVEHVARTIEASLSLPSTLNPLVEMLATITNTNPRDVWTPTTSFLKRLTSPQLDEIMGFIFGKAPTKSFTGQKKGDKVASLHALFNNEADRKGMKKDAIERIATWLPQGFENIDVIAGEVPMDEIEMANGIDDVGGASVADVADNDKQKSPVAEAA